LEPESAFPGSEALTAVGSGVVDLAMCQPGWWAGTMPEMYVAGGLPMSWMSVGEFYDGWYNYGVLEKVLPLYDEYNLKFYPALGMEYMNIFSSFDMPNSASVKGRKIRSWGQWGEFLALMGASPVAIPMGDCYMALKLGTVEGAWMGSQSLITLKISEVATDFVMNPHGCINCLLINNDSFNKLPEELQQLIERETPYRFTVGGLELLQQQGYIIGQTAAETGLQLWTWSEEDMAELRRGSIEKIWPAFAEKSALSAELVGIIKQQLKDHGKL